MKIQRAVRCRACIACAVSLLALLLSLAGAAVAESAQEPGRKAKLPVKTTVRTFGPYDLEAGGLMQVPGKRAGLSFPEPTWILSYTTEVVDPEGHALAKEVQCHTILWSWFTEEWRGRGMDGVPFRGLVSDGYTKGFRVPEGYGIFCDKDEPLVLIQAFNNRTPSAMRASYRVTVEYVKAKDLTRPLKPLYSTLQSIVTPHLYTVKPGQDVRERSFKFPYDGTIHAMSVHLHPYGRTIELINDTRRETAWKAVGKLKDPGILDTVPYYVDAKGYPFRADETYRLRVTYENTTDRDQDAMAGVIFLFSTEDGKLPRATAAAPPRQVGADEDPESIIHGHHDDKGHHRHD